MSKRAEDQIQIAVVEYLRMVLPAGSLGLSPEERKANHMVKGINDGRRNNRAMGVVAGVPDLVCLLPRGLAIFFEIKTDDGAASKSQRAMWETLHTLGFHCALIRSRRRGPQHAHPGARHSHSRGRRPLHHRSRSPLAR